MNSPERHPQHSSQVGGTTTPLLRSRLGRAGEFVCRMAPPLAKYDGTVKNPHWLSEARL